MVEIIFSDFAIEDINSVAEYIALDSPLYASNFVDGVFERIYQLEEFPDSGKTTPESENDNIRELNYGNYRIIYELIS